MKIDRDSGVPIYIQVKNFIMDDIKNGRLKIGEKLPTERDLSLKLKVSRNTISSAYNALEQEGVLISFQGRGTFVAEEANPWKQETVKDKIYKIIDLALEEAIENGFNTKEFLAIVQERVKEKEILFKNLNAVFVECNIEQARFFAEELSRTTNLNVLPMTITQLQGEAQFVEKAIGDAPIIITAFNHVNEVKSFVTNLRKEVFGVATNPSLETIVKIAQYPKGTKIGLMTLSKEFYFKVKYALSLAGLDGMDINGTVSREQTDIMDIVNASDVIVVSHGREEEVRRLTMGKKEIIRFDYILDQSSVQAIMSKIMEIKRRL
ncbi:GntR family transcriptional regulator [Proteiniborus sp. MB09-C3]|uniref:GntR family transcriptional regulator n=1 Tax=Proteiniborus sp. MB09-C3 TaxID=3050072 RepID=UPI0025562C55|nr:GntR family transcriptional regulator [Proteiniborus sp. MB09-C3]WIV10475.1 GntR family transcriptional regulator [Proteiniborus sp. MB09-C3]